MRGRGKSAYFSDDDSKSMSSLSLWSFHRTRTYSGCSLDIHPDDIIPILHIPANVIGQTIKILSESTSIDCNAVLVSNGSLLEAEKSCLETRSTHSSCSEHYRLVWMDPCLAENRSNPFLTLTIPVTMNGVQDFEAGRIQLRFHVFTPDLFLEIFWTTWKVA